MATPIWQWSAVDAAAAIRDGRATSPRASFILSFLDEVVSVVSTVGEAPKPAFLEEARKMLTTPGSTQSPSMFRDLQQGSPIEADQIIGDLIERGGKAGIATPLLAAAYAHMSVYQRRLAKS